MKKEILKEFFRKHVEGTPYKAAVADRKIFLCHLTKAVTDGVGVDHVMSGVYMTTRALKHLFDKKPAEEFLFLLDNLHQIAKYPDKIYNNRSGKRGEFCFAKRIGDAEYLCAIEIATTPPCVPDAANSASARIIEDFKEVQIVTAFRLRDPEYIKNYTVLWDWGNGNPHRSVLDTPEESTNAPQ